MARAACRRIERTASSWSALTNLGMSRPTLMRMIERRGIAFRMVGKHHRIPAASIQKMREFLDEDHMAVVAELANRYGNVD